MEPTPETYRPSSTIVTVSHLAIMADRAVMITIMLTFVLNEAYINRTPTTMLVGVSLSLAFNLILSWSPMCRVASEKVGPNRLLVLVMTIAGLGCLLYSLHLHQIVDIAAIGIIAAARPTEPILVSDLVAASTTAEFINRGRMQTAFRIFGTSVGLIAGSIQYWSATWKSVQILFGVYAAFYIVLVLVVAAHEAKIGPFRPGAGGAEELVAQSGAMCVQTVRPLPLVHDAKAIPPFMRALRFESFWLTCMEMLLLCNCFSVSSPRGEDATVVVIITIQMFTITMLVMREVDVGEMFLRYYTYKCIIAVLGIILLWVPFAMILRNLGSQQVQTAVLIINTLLYCPLMLYIDMGPLFWTKTSQNQRIDTESGKVAAGLGVYVYFNEVQWVSTFAELVVSLLYLFAMPLSPIAGLVINVLIPLFLYISIRRAYQANALVEQEYPANPKSGDDMAARGAVRSDRKWTAGAFNMRFFPSGVNPTEYAAVENDSTAQDAAVELTPVSKHGGDDEHRAEQMRGLDAIVHVKPLTSTTEGAKAVAAVDVKVGDRKQAPKKVTFSLDDGEDMPPPSVETPSTVSGIDM